MNDIEKRKERHREAVSKYAKKVERINVIVPPGTKKRIIKVTDKSCNAFIREMVLAELNKLEKNDN